MIKTERAQIHFLGDVLVAVASLDLKVPNVYNLDRTRNSERKARKLQVESVTRLSNFHSRSSPITTKG